MNLQENKKQIEENRERFVQELEEMQNGVAPLEAQLREKENEKSNIVNKNRYVLRLMFNTRHTEPVRAVSRN